DFFYTCRGHLKDRGFCSPVVDEEEVAARKKREELDREVERIKREYEEKMRRRREKEKEKGKEGDKVEKQKEREEETKAEKERDEKVPAHNLSGSTVGPESKRF
ncbi:MAG: hypothetical protein LQ340_003911, partial [Diploschistes diacapsis]